MKLSTASIGLKETETRDLENSLSRLRGVAMERRFPYYPDASEIERFLYAAIPDVLFVSTASPVQMEATVIHVSRMSSGVELVLIDSDGWPETLRQAMQLGVRECLHIPCTDEDVRGVIDRIKARREKTQATKVGTDALYTFLPARPGVGTSILASQAALCLTTGRSLLMDVDRDAGMAQFLMKVQNPHSFIDALEAAQSLDAYRWSLLVSERGNLDVLQSGNSSDYLPNVERLRHVIAFARRQYSTILIDLPSAVNRMTTELMQQSKSIFLVTTSDAASVHMARRRFRAIEEMQLGDRVRLLLNGVDKKLPANDVAAAVGLPVHATFDADYVEVQKATLSGERIPASRPLGRQLADFTASLSGDALAVPTAKKRRFLEVFALSH